VDFGLESLDELVSFPAGELASRLTLRESHWSSSVAIVGVARGFEQLEELSKLLAVCWWTGRLTKRHAAFCHTASMPSAPRCYRRPRSGQVVRARRSRIRHRRAW
jgi:hypothetical protein